jgi:hypothetical protein
MKLRKPELREIPLLAGMAVGLLAVLLSIVLFCSSGMGAMIYADMPSSIGDVDTGTYTSYNYYGGDAYTGIQQAAADTSRNVVTQTGVIAAGFRSLPRIVRGGAPIGYSTNMMGYGMILLCLGLAMICYFANKWFELCKADAFEAKVVRALQTLAPEAVEAACEAEEVEVPAEAEASEMPEEAASDDEAAANADAAEEADGIAAPEAE